MHKIVKKSSQHSLLSNDFYNRHIAVRNVSFSAVIRQCTVPAVVHYRVKYSPPLSRNQLFRTTRSDLPPIKHLSRINKSVASILIVEQVLGEYTPTRKCSTLLYRFVLYLSTEIVVLRIYFLTNEAICKPRALA